MQPELTAAAAETPTTPWRSARIIREHRWSERTYLIELTGHDGAVETVSFRSVTTILKGGVPAEALIRWAARQTATHALNDHGYWSGEIDRWGLDDAIGKLAQTPWTMRDRKADVGTAVHQVIEQRILGGEPPQLAEAEARAARPYLTQFENFVRRYQPEWLAAEADRKSVV